MAMVGGISEHMLTSWSSSISFTEGEFCFTRRKDFIAVKMQRGYTPDGWLGALIGARLFIEFSHKHPFEESIDDLKKRIRGFHDHDPVPMHPLTIPNVPVAEWTREHIDPWLKKNKL